LPKQAQGKWEKNYMGRNVMQNLTKYLGGGVASWIARLAFGLRLPAADNG